MAASCGDTDVLVLAGGLGSRLRPVVSDRPKPLACVAGRPFLDYLLEILSLYRFRSVTVCAGYLGELFTENMFYYHIETRILREKEPLGTAGALAHAIDELRANGREISDPFLVLNGDSLAEADLRAFVEWFAERTFEAGLVSVRVEEANRYGKLAMRNDETVIGFEEKSKAPGAGSVNAGVYLLRRSVLDLVPRERASSIEREIFPALINDSARAGLAAWEHCSRLIDIGTPDSFAIAQRLVGEIRERVAKHARSKPR